LGVPSFEGTLSPNGVAMDERRLHTVRRLRTLASATWPAER
jgi:hypothetical protein